MAKVAVTGGAGFIGSNLTRRLISEGHEVVVVDDLSTGLISNVDQEKSTFRQVSITDGQALHTAEGYVQAYSSAYKVPTTLLRFFNVFGPRQRPDHEYAAVLPKWIWLAMQGQPIDVYGDGTASRDFTYVDTVLDIAITAMQEKVITEGAMNLAYGNRIFLNDTIEMLRKHFPDLQVNYKPERLGDVKESQNAPELLKKLFPKIQPKEFEIALSETVDWLKEFGQSVANGPATTD